MTEQYIDSEDEDSESCSYCGYLKSHTASCPTWEFEKYQSDIDKLKAEHDKLEELIRVAVGIIARRGADLDEIREYLKIDEDASILDKLREMDEEIEQLKLQIKTINDICI